MLLKNTVTPITDYFHRKPWTVSFKSEFIFSIGNNVSTLSNTFGKVHSCTVFIHIFI